MEIVRVQREREVTNHHHEEESVVQPFAAQQLLDPIPAGKGKSSVESLCSRVFCHEISDSFGVLLCAKPDKQSRAERKVLYVWHYPRLAQSTGDVFQKLSRSDSILSHTLSNPDPKYICMSCHTSTSAVETEDINEEDYYERDEDHLSQPLAAGTMNEYLLKIVAASPTSLDAWHLAFNPTLHTKATIHAQFTISLTHPPTSLAWSEDGACTFSAQRNRLMIWDDALNRIGSIDSQFPNNTDSSSTSKIMKLIYLQRPKEIILAVFENGYIIGWFLEEGNVCISTYLTSMTGRDQSRGVPYQRNDPLVEIHATIPGFIFPQSTIHNKKSTKPVAKHVGHILPSKYSAKLATMGVQETSESVFFTVIACFQSGRIKKAEVEIFPPGGITSTEEIISRVREVASVDLQRELRYRQSNVPSSGDDMIMKREQTGSVLSITPLIPPGMPTSSGIRSAVGYLALLGDSILVLNQQLVVLDLISTGFKGLISLGSIFVPPIDDTTTDISTINKDRILVEAIAIGALTSIAYAVHCPLRYILSSSAAQTSEGLTTLAAQLSLNFSTNPSSLPPQRQQQVATMKTAQQKPPRAPSTTKSRPPVGSSSASSNTSKSMQKQSSERSSSNLQVDTDSFLSAANDSIELDFFASLPSSPSSPLRSIDDLDNETANDAEDHFEQASSSQTTTRRKSLSLLASPDSAKISQMTQTLQKQQQQQLMRTKMKGDWEKPMKDTQGRLINQPVTFHTRIKSSGYGQQPQDLYTKKMLQRKKEKEKEKKLRSTSAPRLLQGNDGGGSRLRLYPLSCQPMQTHLPIWHYPDSLSSSASSSSSSATASATSSSGNQSSPIFHVAFASDASRLAMATASSVALCLRLPRASSTHRDVTAFMGHNHSLQTVCFSHFKQPDYLLLSASKDETARIWKHSRSEQASVLFSHHRYQPSTEVAMNMTMTMLSATSVTASAATSVSNARKLTNPGGTTTMANTSAATAERNRPFGSEIKQAQFYYQDRFVLLTHKSSLGMYSYQLDASSNSEQGQLSISQKRHASTSTISSGSQELTRFLHHGTYRRKHVWEFASTSGIPSTSVASSTASSVTALAAMNSIHSPLILTATSDKSIHVLDANAGRIARSIPQAHEKNISCLAVSQPSPHASLPRDAHQVFLSLAPDNVVCLWDLRQATCILRYTQHVHRREVIHGNFSPCMKYFGTGSEDRTARLFDMVAGKECAVLTGHRDVVTCVAFNPLFAQIATSSYDGTVRFYADADCPLYTSSSHS